MNYKDLIWDLDEPIYDYSNDRGASVEFAVSASDDLYKAFAEKSDIIKESGYDNFEDFQAYLEDNDDYLDIYITARENNIMDVVIATHESENVYPVSLTAKEQKELFAFADNYCKSEYEATLAEMLEEAKEDASTKAVATELYERYKEEWVKDHISDEVMTATEAMYENDEDAEDMTFAEYVEEYGYADGSIYACYEEFLDNEFEAWALANEIEHYLRDRGEYEYPEKDRAPWLDKNGDSTKTEANIRAALTAAPQGLFIHIKRDCAALAPEDELMLKAKLLIKTIEEYCPEASEEKVSKPIERD